MMFFELFKQFSTLTKFRDKPIFTLASLPQGIHDSWILMFPTVQNLLYLLYKSYKTYPAAKDKTESPSPTEQNSENCISFPLFYLSFTLFLMNLVKMYKLGLFSSNRQQNPSQTFLARRPWPWPQPLAGNVRAQQSPLGTTSRNRAPAHYFDTVAPTTVPRTAN